MVKQVITGNMATAMGTRLCRPAVISAYPITPQTTIVEYIADFVADGTLKTQYVKVESEHSAMSCCISASNTGVRTFTATSAHGLLLMHEMLEWAAGARLPIVLVNVNRANGPPWSVWADHHDTIMQRDTGWMSIFCENNQEILDSMIMAFKVAEDPDIMLPMMLSEDAFYLSHTSEPVDVPDQALVDKFLPEYKPEHFLDPENPKGFGSLVMPPQYMEFRYKMAESMDLAREKIRKVNDEFYEVFGRKYGNGLIEEYRCDDAEVVLVGAGTNASTVREVVDRMRDEGHKVGLARLRCFRPFPYEEIRDLAKRVKAIGVFERTYTFGYQGPFTAEIKGALYGTGVDIPIKNYLLGIGGRDIRTKHVRAVFEDIMKVAEQGLDQETKWFGLLDGNTPEEEL